MCLCLRTAGLLVIQGILLIPPPAQNKADAIANDLRQQYPSQLFTTYPADLASRDATRNLVPGVLSDASVAKRHSAISILVANAGIGRRIRDIANIAEDDWDEMMEVNARSQFVVTKACLPGMRAQKWGRIVLVGSIASRGSGLNGCHYAATKGAIRYAILPSGQNALLALVQSQSRRTHRRDLTGYCNIKLHGPESGDAFSSRRSHGEHCES